MHWKLYGTGRQRAHAGSLDPTPDQRGLSNSQVGAAHKVREARRMSSTAYAPLRRPPNVDAAEKAP